LSEQKLFQIFQNKLEFDPTDYLVSSDDHELTDFQKKVIENATAIMKENIVGDVKSFGGNLKANEEKFKELEEKADEELSNEDYTDLKKELKRISCLYPIGINISGEEEYLLRNILHSSGNNRSEYNNQFLCL